MTHDSVIYVAGNTGLVGSALVRALTQRGYGNLVFTPFPEYDLRDQARVQEFFRRARPDYVFLAAAKVGGILANDTYPADFIYDNMMIACNVISAAHRCGVKKLLNLGSSCIYPRLAPQPISEESLLTGSLEPTNEPYAIAKIAAIKLCNSFNRQYGTDFLSVMPTNLYGPGDSFDLQGSHVLPALLRKCHEALRSGATEVTVWGTGKARREFLFVDDLAEAAVFLMEGYRATDVGECINIGTGSDLEISQVAELVCAVVGFSGRIVFDTSKPDGTPRKLLDVSRMRRLGWVATTSLEEGLRQTYEWYLRTIESS
jgi:GDP-L-fucose synthase